MLLRSFQFRIPFLQISFLLLNFTVRFELLYTLYKMSNQLHHPIKWLRFVILSILTATLVYPVLFIVLLPFSIYRLLVKTVVKFTDPKCEEMITGISSAFVGPDPYNKPIVTLAPYLLLTDKIDINQVKEIINEKIIKENLYPEIKQKIVKKFGYYFWKNVDDFNLDNHVRFLHPENPNTPVLRSSLRNEEGDKVVFRSFDERYSPWEIIVVPNVYDPENPSIKSAFYVRVQHCMMDGLSVIKFAQRTGSKLWDWPMAKTFAKASGNSTFKSKLRLLLTTLELVLTGPYLVYSKTLSVNDTSEFINTALGNSKESAKHYVKNKNEQRRVDIKKLNIIRQKHEVGTTSIFTAALAEGVSKYIRKRCNSGFSKLPEEFVLHFVLPLPGHSDTRSTNHWTMARRKIVLNQCSNPVATVKRIHAMYQKLAVSVEPIANKLMFDIIAILPDFLRPSPSQSSLQQLVMFTSFPGPKADVNVFGYNCVDWSILGTSPAKTAIVAGTQTFSEKFWFGAGGLDTIFTKQEDFLLFENYIHGALDEMDM